MTEIEREVCERCGRILVDAVVLCLGCVAEDFLKDPDGITIDHLRTLATRDWCERIWQAGETDISEWIVSKNVEQLSLTEARELARRHALSGALGNPGAAPA